MKIKQILLLIIFFTLRQISVKTKKHVPLWQINSSHEVADKANQCGIWKFGVIFLPYNQSLSFYCVLKFDFDTWGQIQYVSHRGISSVPARDRTQTQPSSAERMLLRGKEIAFVCRLKPTPTLFCRVLANHSIAAHKGLDFTVKCEIWKSRLVKTKWTLACRWKSWKRHSVISSG